MKDIGLEDISERPQDRPEEPRPPPVWPQENEEMETAPSPKKQKPAHSLSANHSEEESSISEDAEAIQKIRASQQKLKKSRQLKKSLFGVESQQVNGEESLFGGGVTDYSQMARENRENALRERDREQGGMDTESMDQEDIEDVEGIEGIGQEREGQRFRVDTAREEDRFYKTRVPQYEVTDPALMEASVPTTKLDAVQAAKKIREEDLLYKEMTKRVEIFGGRQDPNSSQNTLYGDTLLLPQEQISKNMQQEFRQRKLEQALHDHHLQKESRIVLGSPREY